MKFIWGLSVYTYVLHISPFYYNLGYGMTGDLKCLLATWHQFLEEPLKMEGVLDLLSIHQKVTVSCYWHNFIQKRFKLNSAVGIKATVEKARLKHCFSLISKAIMFNKIPVLIYSFVLL